MSGSSEHMMLFSAVIENPELPGIASSLDITLNSAFQHPRLVKTFIRSKQERSFNEIKSPRHKEADCSPMTENATRLDIAAKVIPESRESSSLNNLDVEATTLACPFQSSLQACQTASIVILKASKVDSSYCSVSRRIPRHPPCHRRLEFPV